jgi:hypothetical protein
MLKINDLYDEWKEELEECLEIEKFFKDSENSKNNLLMG